ncbi:MULTISPECIES: hypothetical protein [Pirellulaceae]|uniref:Uncharacterized protein n=1 Tax=Aporhodopirellula rubra TaxID=980271 RepID=A0A7W5DZN6_9BACT|nr:MULTISPECIES: hypothetical protein [Pirellulaceae]EMI41630.1 hypothetical protein RRSWK_05920 [Rhodopirellula sp. SWK7]MBB3206567.1 hypothetical protein [Aporhodopirellula rubra]
MKPHRGQIKRLEGKSDHRQLSGKNQRQEEVAVLKMLPHWPHAGAGSVSDFDSATDPLDGNRLASPVEVECPTALGIGANEELR